MKKALPYILFALLVVTALLLRNGCSRVPVTDTSRKETATSSGKRILERFRDPGQVYYFTKHARCRMQCRRISQEEVKEIVQLAQVNYRKSDLQAAGGPTYSLEGTTRRDRQRIRVVVAPKQRHLSIVTVIDLDYDWECPRC
ncbi:MAG TPA: DUF4258 domain-containing protein [Lacibacter sp.]|nr:DUF4258 domain-containing protein [Lacibacter sp.]HMO89132.1 DUF4258 domain-containing protein [Lacibacter sp.]HMP86613.1 DUF4258 domain-containing protein [Lacibacter sp.]